MFFIEGVFLAVYLYSWDAFSPRKHFLVGLPLPIAGTLATLCVVAVNAWMNDPRGFTLDAVGNPTDIDPVAALFGGRTVWIEFVHLWLAALIVTGFLVGSVYAFKLLRGATTRYDRRAFALSFGFAASVVLPQLLVGDLAAQHIAREQPVKLAAAETLTKTQTNAPLEVGGWYAGGENNGAVRIPDALSLLAFHDRDAVVIGLDAVPLDERPPVNVVHLAFDAMVAAGTALLAFSAWWVWRRRRARREETASTPNGHLDERLAHALTSRRFLWAAVASGPLAVLALEAGWVVTEVGRQPWIVYRLMRTADAASQADGLELFFLAIVGVYVLVTVSLVLTLRRMAAVPLPKGFDD